MGQRENAVNMTGGGYYSFAGNGGDTIFLYDTLISALQVFLPLWNSSYVCHEKVHHLFLEQRRGVL